MTSRPAARSTPTVSRTMRRFSSRVARSARSTWTGSDLATMVMTGAPESMRARTWGSSAAAAPGLQVEPKATSRAVRSSRSSRTRPKSSVSLGMAPGQPASM